MQSVDLIANVGVGTLNLNKAGATKDTLAFNNAIDAFKKADFIRFSGNITNQEAQFLQSLKLTFGKKIVSQWSYQFKDFLENYLAISDLFATKDDIVNADTVLVFGTKLDVDCPDISALIHGKKIALLHPIEEHDLDVAQFIKYEPSSEDGVAALLAFALCDKEKLNSIQQEYIDSLDDGFLSGEASFDETEQEELRQIVKNSKQAVMIVGADLYFHKNSSLIAKLLGMLSCGSGIKILFLPPEINSFGVIKYCDLDFDAKGSSVGYEEIGDFIISSFTNEKSGLKIASFFEKGGDYIDYFKNLQQIETKKQEIYQIDDFINTLSVNFTQNEQPLKPKKNSETYEEIEAISEMNGALLYFCHNPNLSQNRDIIIGSKSFAAAAKVVDKKSYMATFNNESFNVTFNLETNMKGTIAIMPPKSPGYRFVPVVMREV